MSGAFNGENEDYFEGDISYDKNGNVFGLKRIGARANNDIDLIDELTYGCHPNSNQLKKVADTDPINDFIDGNTKGNDYTYDLNGNMIEDKNKEIINIEYNHLNLPKKVYFRPSNIFSQKYIAYAYDARGVKLAKYVQDESLASTHDTYYAGAFIYKKPTGMSNTNLKFITQSEGYIEPDNQGGFDYVYQFKDHLGNVRLTYADSDLNGNIDPSTEIISETNYYPFGLEHKGYNNVVSAYANSVASRFGYNGKELNDKLDLNWHDFGARNYIASLGRWMNVDPIAMVYSDYSPYRFTLNNPIYFKDPDGRQVVAYDKETQDIILSYITDQLGENNGFYFNNDGILNCKKRILKKTMKEFKKEQSAIANGLIEVIDHKDRVVEIHSKKDSDKFTVSTYRPGFVINENDGFEYDENGLPKREGWERTNTVADISTSDSSGAKFWVIGKEKHDNTNQSYAHLVINRQTISTIQFQSEEGKLTVPSASSAFIHEIIDHGLDFVRNGNIDITFGESVENVKFHNLALNNISNGESPLRQSHHVKK